MNLMHVAGVVVTVAFIIALHMSLRVFHAPDGKVLWRIARYIGGCLAILIGLVFVLDWLTLLQVGIIFVAAGAAAAGAATVGSYLVVELYNYYQRAQAAEQDADGHYD